MKYILLITILLLTSISIGKPGFAAFHGASNRLVIALDDNGDFFRLASGEWVNIENPCPGDGPFKIDIAEHPFYPESLLIYSFDTYGRAFYFTDSVWSAPIEILDSSQPGCLCDIYNVNESGVGVIIVDRDGNVELSSNRISGFSISPFTIATPRSLVALYDNVTTTIAPFILDEDGRLYVLMTDEWELMLDSNIIDFDTFMHPKTGDVFVMAIDSEGLISDNFSGEFKISNLNNCPGEAPFNIRIVFTLDNIFDILCLDSTGNLFIANTDFTWDQIASGFAQ